MQCEVCGRQIAGKPQKVMIERAKMLVCEECASLGSICLERESKVPKKSPRRKDVKTIATVPLKRKDVTEISEDLEIIEGFGSIVRGAREKLGLTHEDFGRRIGEKVSIIRKVEAEKMTPNLRLAAKLEHTLRVKLVVPTSESPSAIPTSTRIGAGMGVTLGEVVHLKGEKRRVREDEGDHSSSKGSI